MAEARSGDPAWPDPQRVVTQQDFGRELSALRVAAGLTVRQAARIANLPASTAGDYFAGRHLPPLGQPGLLARILGACGENDPQRLGEWKTALRRARRAPGRRSAAAAIPYRGLASFQPADAPWFFGREELTQRLVTLARDARAAGVPLAVVGPSGSGKSSLLRAGLIPALATGGPRGQGSGPAGYALFAPGARPVDALAQELQASQAAGTAGCSADDIAAAMRSQPPSAEPAVCGMIIPQAIIADQFEETFTACQDEAERRTFITVLCALARRSTVVLGLRADCYGHALRYPELAAAMQERQVVVGPMSPEQLRRAIVEPARHAGLELSEGLVELLLRDLMPRTGPAAARQPGHDAGALPLLSHALLSTWERSRGARLTVADYQASGGIQNAIARTAESAYDALAGPEREEARRLFLRLVRVTDESTETRHRVPLSELAGSAGAIVPASDVLWRFVGQRLITVTEDTAQISHEALLAGWPRIGEWIDADRDGLRVRRRITDGSRTWLDAGRDSAALPRGGQLAIVRDWAADPLNQGSLGVSAREFVEAGIAQERAEGEAARRRSRQLRRLVAALTALVVVAVGLAGYAFAQRRAANSARDSADSRELAVEANQLRGQDVSQAAQLSLAAYQAARTPDAVASLLESSGTPVAARLADSADVIQAVTMSPTRHILAVAGADGTLRLWNTARSGRPVPIGRPLAAASADALYTVAFSPDGALLAAAGAGGTVRLWNVSRPRRPVPVGPPLTGPPLAGLARTIYSVAFSRSGALAAGSADGTVRLWQLAASGQAVPLDIIGGQDGYVQAVAFSPDGAMLAAGTADGAVRLWNLVSPRHLVLAARLLPQPASVITSVAFSPDGKTLAAGSQGKQVWRWSVARPARPAPLRSLTGSAGFVNSVEFSPDGSLLAAASSDDSVRLWSLATGRLLGTLPHPDVVTSVAWAGAHLLVSGCADGAVRLWRLPPPVLMAAGSVNSIAFSPAGAVLAIGSQDLETWDPVTRTQLGSAAVPGGTFVNAVAYAPGGSVLAAGYGNGSVQLWTAAGGAPVPLSPVISAAAAASGSVEFVAVSPGGQILASGADDGTVRLWDIRDPARPVQLANLPDAHIAKVYSVAFSPDGRTLAAASTDNLTRLWDIAAPAHPALIGRPLAGASSYDLSLAFSPDGRTLAIGSADKTVRIWNVADPARPRLMSGPLTGPEGYVYALAFSPDGRTLAAGNTDDTVWLWNLSDPARPALVAELTGPAGHVYSVAFNPDGTTLAAGSADGTVRLWDTSARAAARAVCATSGQPLTRSQWQRYAPGRDYSAPCAGG